MGKLKTALVLEGGGMRGAYTAGTLSWLIDNNIEFDNCYGISTGAVHLCNYLLKDKDNLKDFSTEYINDKNAVGIKPLLRMGKVVDYDYLFHKIMPTKTNFKMENLKKIKPLGKVGLYELQKGETQYMNVKDMSIDELKAACSLPVLGKVVHENGRDILDGGITEMIPIKEALKDGCDKFLVITTKPQDFVRKPSKFYEVAAMKIAYPKWPCVGNDYAVRADNYNDQIDRIKALVDKGDAVYCFPTRSTKVTRLGGSHQDLLDLFNLGYQDAENKKAEIMALFKQC